MSFVEKSQASANRALARFAEAADVDTLVALINTAFVVEQVAIEGDRVNRAALEKYMRTGSILLLEENGVALGCVYVEKRDDRGYLGLLSVQPNLQGRGLGRRLVAAAEKHAKENGCRAMDLRVLSARPEIVPFYEKCGYSITGTSPMPPEVPLKTPCHFVHMTKTLA